MYKYIDHCVTYVTNLGISIIFSKLSVEKKLLRNLVFIRKKRKINNTVTDMKKIK